MSRKTGKPYKLLPATVHPASAGDGDAQKNLGRAIQHHQAGHLMEAQAGYRKVLEIQPEQADALHMMGVLAYQAGSYEESISLITRAQEQMPPSAGLYTNLGNALQASGRVEEAVAAFRTAIQISPDYSVASNNLGNALRLQGKLDEAVAAFLQALSVDRNYTEAHVNLAIAYQAQGKVEQAVRCYQNAVALDPNHKSALHMLAALRGEATESAPGEHVTRLFDEYAERFDHHLVDTLGYSMPGLLRSEIDRLRGLEMHFRNAIDLGCGTGLAGVAFRPVCEHLTGIDLSQRMIDKARVRNVYDELLAGDLITSLDERQKYYDLLVCADVFPYIGNIKPLFSAVRSHAGNAALFAFSTELYLGDGYVLHPSGRYAHSREYLRTVAAEYGFSVLTMRTENLRKQKGQWIPGDLVVLQHQGQSESP